MSYPPLQSMDMDISTFQYIITHVFCPLHLPDGDDYTTQNEHSLARAVASIVHLYRDHVDPASVPQWGTISRMLDNLELAVRFESLARSQTTSQLIGMNVGDVLTFHVRAQNVAVIFRKQRTVTIFEAFEVSPKTEVVMNTQGKLLRSYPGPAIEIPNSVFEDKGLLSELANFLVHMNVDVIPDAVPTTQKASSTVREERDTTDPRYVTELLTGILRTLGRPAEINRIMKRVGDDVVWNNSKLPWRRSSLWLVIRVAIQTSLDLPGLEHSIYKQFMLFFMCHLADLKTCADISNDALQFMLAKISRRLRKLGSSAPDWLSDMVLKTCTSLRLMLERRWEQVQDAQQVSPFWAPSRLDLSRDTELSLLRSRDYLTKCLDHHSAKPVAILSRTNHRRRGSLDDFLSSDGSFFDEAYDTDPHLALYDVERAVEQGIDDWVDQVTDSDKACVKLEILGNKYSSRALKTYKMNPELLSVMLLTTIELWVALDKIATKAIPMLAEYSPEVPTSLFEDLLLCKNASLLRLRYLHQYLSHRYSQAHSQRSVFSPTVDAHTFSVRYYRATSHLQTLKSQIEERARHEVDEKASELQKSNARHVSLEQEAARADHVFDTDWYGRSYHSGRCRKCELERELSQMEIALHEWPLPASQLHAEAVVFELDCPVSFNMWRSATFNLLVDICSPSVEPDDPHTLLSQYHGLQSYLVRHPRSRITLASQTKPFVVSHYSKMQIPTTQERVCVNNGLTFYGFDSHACIPASKVQGAKLNIRRYCTYGLQSGPYQNMQKYVDATSHTSNDILANQIDCDSELSIHEYFAFGHLRSGSSLQWLNLLRELRARSLTFRRPEIHMLLAQAVSQVGPLSNMEWTWHEEAVRPSYCHALLGELENLVRDIQASWLEATTMDTVSFLLRRILTSCPDQVVSERTVKLLRSVRGSVFHWVEELSVKLTRTPGDDAFRGYLRDAAAICRSTFDVDHLMIQPLLHSPEDIKVLLASAILIHDHTPGEISSLPAYSQLLLDRDRRLSLVLESSIRDVVQADPSDQGINLAVRWIWPDYRPNSKWIPLQDTNSRWLTCTTASTAKWHSQEVHFNLLDGTLLVNGKPLGRLPNEILRHPLYNLIFGEQVLDVILADLSGMDYSTRGMISNHKVYFSLRNDSDLVIQAKRKPASSDLDTIELIPQEKLEGDLPEVLIKGHAHWLNLSEAVIEIRPLDRIWETSSENWRIDCSAGQYRMRKGDERLVDIRSQSWNMVSNLLKPFDIPQNLLVSVSKTTTSSPQLSVILPRYGLSFYVDEDGDFQCQNMRGMVYDENQCVGTLYGLVDRLVLRSKTSGSNAAELIPRCILIPEGDVSFQKDGNHVRVEIRPLDKPTFGRVTYQCYRVDADMGCLTGDISLTNKLYCAYLHALTSGCGPDPLTGRSGTEEALSILRSAGCSSIMKLGSREAELLRLIASICPSRTWYPEHLKCMQKVEWLDLPASAQHHDLYLEAKRIKEHCEKVLLFRETRSGDLFQSFPLRDEHLLKRSALRAMYLFPSSECSEPSLDVDSEYRGRDLLDSGSGEHRAYTAAAAVYHRTTNRDAGTTNILKMAESWMRSLTGDTALSLQYDQSWLAPESPLIWLKAYKLLRGNDGGKWFQLLFSLPAMAFASPSLTTLVPIFVSFAENPEFLSEDPPRYDSYDLSEGYQPSRGTLWSYVSNCAHSFNRSPESHEPARYNESTNDLQNRRRHMYFSRRNSDADATVQQFLGSWPCETPPRSSLNPNLYNVSDLTSNTQRHFLSCYRNLKLKEHLNRVQTILDNVYPRSSPTQSLQYTFQPSRDVPSRPSWSVTVDQLFARPAPMLQAHDRLPLSPARDSPLRRLLTTVEQSTANPFQRHYTSALRKSAECFEHEASPVPSEPPTGNALTEHYARCKVSYTEALRNVKQHLRAVSQSERALEQAGQWPCITTQALLRSLASNSPTILPDHWKECLIRLTLLALELQRARRLLRLHMDSHFEELRKELQNEGCDGWNADVHPDWLLIQLQGNFLVRRVQAEVANEMISPCSGVNTAMQLNMGEGKSSVIVPVVVVALADGTQLVRVVVPKALTTQMFNLLADRLGGLINRRIYFLPFSRSLEVDEQKLAVLREILSTCMKERGILIVQPEHILSLKLVSVEQQLPEQNARELADQFLDLQKWFHSHSRDILDESDEILHVRYQLVYTIGNQQHMEGFPDRWTVTEHVLGLVGKFASLRNSSPDGVEYEVGPPGSFPHLRVLHADAGQGLISWIVRDIMDGRLPKFNFGQLRSHLRDAIRKFISCESVSPVDVQVVKDYCHQTSLWGGLLLLRGLLATGILLYAFRERRWRVDYGLSPMRTMLAVPYRAKDVPAQRAEFGHPDIAIILTCLSYYYGGLTEEQLQVSFEILFKQDDPSLDYDSWIQGCPSVPESLRTLNGVNIRSSEQWKEHLYPLFRRNQATVDFYLSNVVFPKEAKEFPSKLSCSGWDLAEKKARLVTGFSGTNDGQYLLPLHITQRDLDHQRGTNAKILSFLLRPENNHYMSMSHKNGDRLTTCEFLTLLASQTPEIRVLLDVGAQMLDLENSELAETWLAITSNVSAAIYFNKDDELTVLTRDGHTHPLLSSPFAQQLDQCIVYLDDAHTRGTDIKFPSGFRAAVTLGPKVTKDRLTQGCMRMRKLGHGHSVMFFAPHEIERRIRFMVRKSSLDAIGAMDIMQWVIRETCDDIQQRAPHWVQQGIDHASRYAAWTSFCQGELSSEGLYEKWCSPEAKTLVDLYGPQKVSNLTLLGHPDINERCKMLGISTLRDVSMDEEQEREVLHEAERERQVERPPKVPAATHSIHPDVVTFINTGVVPEITQGFRSAFQTLDATSIAVNEAHIWSPNILATADFQVAVSSSGRMDDYLRPVMWVASGKRGHIDVLVILSPYEVNYFLPFIRSGDKVHLHLYTPRVTKSMKSCDDLSLYSIPAVPTEWTPGSRLMDQLNMFAGQLYLKDYETYIRLCRFLCLYSRELRHEEGIEVGSDGFILPNGRPWRWSSDDPTFQTTPLNSLKTLIGLRRKGMRFAPTHMGKLVDGRLLSEEDFEDGCGARFVSYACVFV